MIRLSIPMLEFQFMQQLRPHFLLPLFVFLLSGCMKPLASPLLSPTQTTASPKVAELHSPDTSPGIYTAISTITTTVESTPSIDSTRGIREWYPAEMLIQAGTIHEREENPFNMDPWLLLYSNGLFIKKDCIGTECRYTTAQLSEKDICILLNTIDQNSFFAYDPSGYVTPLVGGEITYIDISTWQQKSVALYQLEDWIEDPGWLDRLLKCSGCRKGPEIAPSLATTYSLLKTYSPSDASPYVPDRLAVWLSQPVLAGEPTTWEIRSPSLSRLYEMSSCTDPNQHRVIILSGSEAKWVSDAINAATSQGKPPVFTEGSLVFELSTRWMLPGEQAAGCGESSEQFHTTPSDSTAKLMVCTVQEGFLPTVTPSWRP